MYNDFLLANLSCQFLRQFWLARVGNLTNEADVEQNSFMVNFSDNSDVRQGFKASLRDFGIETSQEEQQKAIDMFLEGNDVSISLPTGYGKSLIY